MQKLKLRKLKNKFILFFYFSNRRFVKVYKTKVLKTMKEITLDKLKKYISVTEKAISKAEKSGNRTSFDRDDCLDMIKRYFSDALHFKDKGDFVNAFAALNYAHGWLDSGVRLKVFDVDDDALFTVC